MLEEKLLRILNALLKEFEAWIRGESEEVPLIIEIHEKAISNDTYPEQGIINSVLQYILQ
ncbi:hypothetical protein HS5_11560 [Acidianus sp. HS-5]|nr:hypothetical protein HS5_11560 [Acidianus sp. HS-5]